MPMFNEKGNIKRTINKINSLAEELTNDYEIIIVDDASTDRCADIVREVAETNDGIRLLYLKENTRFGGAYAEGLKQATKEIILYMDSDMPVRIQDIRNSLPLIKDTDIVTGYSKVKKGNTINRRLMSGIYNLMVQFLFRLNIKDINSGYKIFKRDVVKDIEFISRSPFVNVELFLHANKNKYKVTQFPLEFQPRECGKSYITQFPIIRATITDMLKMKLFLCRKSL